MRSENYIIQLQLENQRLQKENTILDIALLNTCQMICRSMNYSQEEIIKLKQRIINRARNNFERAYSDEETK